MKVLTFFHRKIPQKRQKPDIRLFMRYREAVSACGELEAHTGKTKEYLAGKYMLFIGRETEKWKKENEEFLFESFFIYDYLAEKGVIERQEIRPMLLRPEGEAETGMCEIKIISHAESADTGRVEIKSLYGASPEKALWGMGFAEEKGKFVITVTDKEAPLLERAAEAGAMLIDNCFAVCVFSKRLYEKIHARDYTAVNRYRVFAPENDFEIGFAYPWNPPLHRQLFRAGAKWNGRYMAMPLSMAANAQDMIRLYGFFVEPSATKRMEAWFSAEKYARVMPKKLGGYKEEEALIKSFLSRPIEVLEDLKDE